MIYRSVAPPYPLDQFVESFWYHRGYCPEHTKEKLLPSGAIDIIIDLKGGPKKLFEQEDFQSWKTLQNAWISGQHREFIVFEPGGDSDMIGVRFRPGGAHPFFDFRIAELNGSVIELDLAWGNRVHLLRERLQEAPEIGDKFEILHDFLVRTARRELIQDPIVSWAIDRICQSPETVAMREIAQASGVSSKHLIRKFDHLVGLKPKTFSRVIKFQKVVQLIEQKRDLSWTHLAYDCGYYDQAHFIHEFRAFSGLNPTRYLTERGEFLNFMPVA